MRHRKFEKLIVLQLYDEASPDEEIRLNEHVLKCRRCREFKEDISKFLPARTAAAPFSVDGSISEARKSVRRVIADEVPASQAGGRVRWIEPYPRRLRVPVYVTAVVALVMLGVGAGSTYLLVNRGAETGEATTVLLSQLSAENPGDVAVNDVRFLSSDPKTGEINFSFNFIKRYQMKGSLDDRNVQKVLAYALVNSDNPGTRLRTIGVLDATRDMTPDPEIKSAILRALTSDQNAGVRRQALASLAKLPFDGNTKDAVLTVLQKDPNPGMRVAAINLLSEKVLGPSTDSKAPRKVDPKVLNVLKERSVSDQNKYVRLKAADMLKEFREL